MMNNDPKGENRQNRNNFWSCLGSKLEKSLVSVLRPWGQTAVTFCSSREEVLQGCRVSSRRTKETFVPPHQRQQAGGGGEEVMKEEDETSIFPLFQVWVKVLDKLIRNKGALKVSICQREDTELRFKRANKVINVLFHFTPPQSRIKHSVTCDWTLLSRFKVHFWSTCFLQIWILPENRKKPAL